MKYQDELQAIDSQEKAYLLGLIYADGCIYSSSNGTNICTNIIDENWLIKIHKLFPFYNLNRGSTNTIQLQKTDKNLYEHLLQHGMLPKKSSINRELLKFPKLTRNLYSHFVRGFFDGDGSVYKQKKNNIKVEIGCTSFAFTSELLKYLYDQEINCSLTRMPKGKGKRTIDFYRIYTGSYKESRKFADLIYKDANIWLPRKREKLDVILVDTRPKYICEFCQTNSIVLNGTRNNKFRVYCKKCKKHSSVTALNISDDIVVSD